MREFRLFLFVALTLILCSPVSNANDLPNLSSLSYSTNNPYYNAGYGGQCTAFAWGRAQEKLGISFKFNTQDHPSAKDWWIYGPVSLLKLSTGNIVQGNAIAVWGGDSSNTKGHVAFVERVENGIVYFNEANVKYHNGSDWGGGYDGSLENLAVSSFENRGTGVGIILGYIYLGSSGIPDTGQTKCYDGVYGNKITCPSPGQALYGQDANYTINPMSYTKQDSTSNALSDSATSWITVRDNVTGLIWENKTVDGTIHDKNRTFTWYDSNPATNGGYAGTPGTDTEYFIRALNSAHFGGYSDWRLPTVNELRTIINYSIIDYKPRIDIGYFPNTLSSFYWAATTNVQDAPYAWGVNFGYDSSYSTAQKRSIGYVRAVRGGQSVASIYTDNGNGTVTDISTGLVWQKASSSYERSWEQALAYCEGLNLGDNTDWRLPTIKELLSLADHSRYEPAINTIYFPGVSSFSSYWSSTTNAYLTFGAWCVYFGSGVDVYPGKTTDRYVRAVRGGQGTPTPTPTPPAPKIQANGQDGPITVTVTENTPVSITVSLAPGDQNGKNADWWAVMFYSTWFSLTPYNTWALGLNTWAQKPLYGFSPVEIYNSTVGVGETVFCFGVDMSPNGILDLPLYADCVCVNGVTSTPIVKYEAEASNNTLGGGAVLQSCSFCSNGFKVGYIGYGGELQFNNVIGNGSNAEIMIYYVNGDQTSRFAEISVNDNPPTTLEFGSSGDWNTANAKSIKLNLVAGNNTIKFANPNGWAPDFDYITLERQITGSRVYFNDFGVSAGSEWSNPTVATSNGESFLGASSHGFGPGSNTLSLSKLSAHNKVKVSFDLYIIETWDGNGAYCCGPDNWQLTADGTTLLYTNFANCTSGGVETQAYPNQLPPYGPGGSFAPGEGAFATGHLGFGSGVCGDRTYRLSYTFAHTAPTLTLTFTGMEDQDEGWGIDNVQVDIIPVSVSAN